MAIAVIQEADEATPEIYDEVQERLNMEQDRPKGLILASGGKREGGGMRFVDVWESEEDMQRFEEERLMPVLQEILPKHGIALTPPERTVYELHDLVH